MGSSTATLAPISIPGEETVRLPPCCSTMPLLMNMPRPDPCPDCSSLALNCTPSPPILATCCALSPTPESVTVTTADPLRTCWRSSRGAAASPPSGKASPLCTGSHVSVTTISPSLGVNLRLLEIRLRTTWERRVGSPTTRSSCPSCPSLPSSCATSTTSCATSSATGPLSQYLALSVKMSAKLCPLPLPPTPPPLPLTPPPLPLAPSLPPSPPSPSPSPRTTPACAWWPGACATPSTSQRRISLSWRLRTTPHRGLGRGRGLGQGQGRRQRGRGGRLSTKRSTPSARRSPRPVF
mmetsp:Transcript_25848/g.55883  ORF Transcript_25848/g.55883 Transcript_25848/m.55883 type:complete len:295 (+) Transcript_25848:1159-2043(+)